MAGATALLGAALACPRSAQAGFLDELFAPLFRPHFYRVYGAYPRWDSERFRRRENRFGHRQRHQSAAPQWISVPETKDHPGEPQQPVDIMDDGSLRKGDTVVTEAGIRIFIGASGDSHEPEDFRRPSEIRGLSRTERKALAALDAKAPADSGASSTVTGRSATEAGPSTAQFITDAKGRVIRYVGP